MRAPSAISAISAVSAISVALALLVTPASARADAASKPAFFYWGYDYGSQATFSPSTVFLNRAFDVFQLRGANRDPFRQPYGRNAENVLDSLASPIASIEARGSNRFVREELLPVSFTAASARWAPNYGLHLIGGGVTYRALTEWFAAHEVPLPAAFSILTIYSAAFLNETLENKQFVGPNTDAIADLYVFDLAGIVLFSINPVARFFSKTLVVSDWSLQPSILLPKGSLQNQGNYYAVKLPVPRYERLQVFGYLGFSTMGGLSFKVTPEVSLSAAAGARVERIENTSTATLANEIRTKASGALFVDKNDSLLASVQVSDVADYTLHVNVYPNALFHTKPGVGFFGVVSREGRVMGGISLTGSLGLGMAAGNFR